MRRLSREIQGVPAGCAWRSPQVLELLSSELHPAPRLSFGPEDAHRDQRVLKYIEHRCRSLAASVRSWHRPAAGQLKASHGPSVGA